MLVPHICLGLERLKFQVMVNMGRSATSPLRSKKLDVKHLAHCACMCRRKDYESI